MAASEQNRLQVFIARQGLRCTGRGCAVRSRPDRWVLIIGLAIRMFRLFGLSTRTAAGLHRECWVRVNSINIKPIRRGLTVLAMR